MLNRMILPKLNTTKLEYNETSVDLESFDVCPVCGKTISPKFIYAHFTHTSKSTDLQETVEKSFVNALFECPDCSNGILAKYNVTYQSGESEYHGHGFIIRSWNTFNLISSFPTPIAQFPYQQIITDVSSRFKKIYTQALQAKLDGKDELVGIGYRKAIEFLIKDYLLYIKHEKSDKIPTMNLGDCIKLIDNQKIENLAKASTWLGNDETHYVRKHSDKDINDLESFLNALVYYLTYELTVEQATSFISK